MNIKYVYLWHFPTSLVLFSSIPFFFSVLLSPSPLPSWSPTLISHMSLFTVPLSYIHSSSPTVTLFTFLVSVVIPDYKLTTKYSEPGSTECVKKLRFLFWRIEIQIIHAIGYVVRPDTDMSCIPMLVHDRRQKMRSQVIWLIWTFWTQFGLCLKSWSLSFLISYLSVERNLKITIAQGCY